ncbi:MAG: translocation/assembly module TamB domain-containing protein [Thermoanaerobaculia bacterium]
MSEPPEPSSPGETAPAEPEPVRKRPGRVRRWVVRPFFWGLLLLAALGAGLWFFVQSRLAREKLRERLVAPVSHFLNREVRIGSVDYSFFPPTFELRDVVIPGPRPADPPVARVPYAALRVSVQDLGKRRFDIDEIEVLRPQVYLQVNPDGSTNLPEFRFSSSNGPQRFDVRIGHILVQDGTFQLNERHLPFHLDAKAIWGRGIGRAERGGKGGNRIDLLATAQEVVATLPHARPYAFTVSARGSVVPEKGRIEIANTRFAGPDLTGRANGFVDYRSESRRVELDLHADGQAQWVNRVGWAEQPLAGPLAADARFLWTSAGWSYRGTVTSPRFTALGRLIQDIRASFTGGPDGVDVGVERVRYAEGSFKGLISVDTTQKGPGVPVSLDLDLADLSIHKLLADQFPGEDLPIVGGLSGRTGGTFEYRFNSERVLAGSGRADLHVRGTAETGLPVAGDLPITLDRGVISGHALHLTAPGQDITSSGFTYDLQRGSGQFDFRLASADVGPLGPVLLGPSKRGEEPAFWLPTAGRGTAAGSFQFARKEYALQLALDLQNVVAPVTAADTVRGSLTLSPRALDNLRLELARNGGALLVTGRVPLPETGRKTASQPFNLAIEAAQWQASGLAYLLGPELTKEFAGELSGSVDLSGFPDRLTGRIDATAVNVTAYGYPVGKARAVGSFEGGHITIEQGQVETPAGTVFAHGTFDQPTGGMNLTLLAPALSLGAEPFQRLLGGDLTGTMSVEAAASGTLSEPRATVSVRGRDLALAGRLLGQQGETSAVATWDGQRVDLRGSLLGLASFQGNGRLDRRGADVAVDLRSDQLGALARALSPQPLPDFTGSFLGTTTLAADFGAGTFHAGVRLADLRLQYQGRTVASREPVVVDLSSERAVIQSLYLAEPGTENELTVHGTVGFARGVPLDLQFQSTLAATWLGLVLPPEYRAEGAADLLGTVRGTLDDPRLSGQGEIRGGRLIVPELAQSIDGINGFLSFNQSRISIDGVRARMGNNGTLVFAGGVDLPRAGRELSYRITADARDVSVRFPEFLNNRGNAVLTLVSDTAGRRIEGSVELERALYVQDINVDLLELVQGLFQRQRLELAATDTFQTTTQLSIGIQGRDALRVRNNVANLQGDVALSVRGTLARPVVFGDVVLDTGGTLLYNDNQYQVQRGYLRFSNPERIDPVVDLVATTEVQGFNITLTLGGTLEHPDIHLASDSNLADLEIFSLIAGSQRPTESPFAPPPTAAEQQAASGQLARQFLAGQAAGAFSKRVGTLFRFDRFRIDPVVQAGQPVSGIGITVGKRLSKDVFITYSTLPTTGQQYIVQVEWQVRKNLTLVLTQVGDGTYAVDAQWQRRF